MLAVPSPTTRVPVSLRLVLRVNHQQSPLIPLLHQEPVRTQLELDSAAHRQDVTSRRHCQAVKTYEQDANEQHSSSGQ